MWAKVTILAYVWIRSVLLKHGPNWLTQPMMVWLARRGEQSFS
jgi:hypothetical protein